MKSSIAVEIKLADEDLHYSGADDDFGGPVERRDRERKLLWKLDIRMAILVVMYILNYVRIWILAGQDVCTLTQRFPRQLARNNAGYVYTGLFSLCCVELCPRSAARLRGFEADLHLKGQQFATLLSILYVGYILMQISS